MYVTINGQGGGIHRDVGRTLHTGRIRTGYAASHGARYRVGFVASGLWAGHAHLLSGRYNGCRLRVADRQPRLRTD